MPIDFRGAVVMAPMVRVGTLPMRLLALDYGADLVYVEEIIDHRLLGCGRVVNSRLGTVDFVHRDGSVVFRTCQLETPRVVLQLGTADPDRAVAAAKLVEADVACIDVNMGCPKDYSTKGGMGAALIKDAPRAVAILRALVTSLSVPVTCKIRILPSVSDTVALAKSLASTGISCLAVHGRFKEERPRHPNHADYIAAVSRAIDIPVLANGGSCDTVKLPLDVEYFRRLTGAAGVMLARAAMRNPSIFSSCLQDRLVPSEQLACQYIKYAITYDNPFPQSKYCLQQLLHDRTDSDEYRATLVAQTWHDICSQWGVSDWYANWQRAQHAAAELAEAAEAASRLHQAMKRKATTVAADNGDGQQQLTAGEEEQESPSSGLVVVEANAAAGPLTKRRLIVDESGQDVAASFRYLRRLYRPDTSPKQLLHIHCRDRNMTPPEYKTDFRDRLYYSQVTVAGNVYRNVLGDQSKRYAEHGAACICLVHMGLSDGRKEEESLPHQQPQQQPQQQEAAATS